MREKVIEFIVDYLEREYSLPEGIDYATFDYVKNGYVDSIGMIQFIATLEDEFEIEFTDEELGNENYWIIGNMADLIVEKQSGK